MVKIPIGTIVMHQAKDDAGRVVVVTGGTSPVSRRWIRHLGSLGMRIVFSSSTSDDGVALEQELRLAGYDVHFVRTDVRDEESVYDLIDQTIFKYRRIDAVICNERIVRTGSVVDGTASDWDAMMDVNVRGVLNVFKYALPEMEKAAQGVIVVTTVAPDPPKDRQTVYATTQGALHSLVRRTAHEYEGVVRTVGLHLGDEESAQSLSPSIPASTLGVPLDDARAAAFLTSDSAQHVNGVIVTLS